MKGFYCKYNLIEAEMQTDVFIFVIENTVFIYIITLS